MTTLKQRTKGERRRGESGRKDRAVLTYADYMLAQAPFRHVRPGPKCLWSEQLRRDGQEADVSGRPVPSDEKADRRRERTHSIPTRESELADDWSSSCRRH